MVRRGTTVSPPQMAALKRRCFAADPDLDGMEDLLETLVLGPGPDSSAGFVHLSFKRVLESRPGESESSRVIETAMSFGSALLEAAKMSERKRSALHNSVAWPLSPELTVKVFSELDMHSICYVAASCSMFKKYATDPLCCANIDLTSPCPKVTQAWDIARFSTINRTSVCAVFNRVLIVNDHVIHVLRRDQCGKMTHIFIQGLV